jgi:hypothetical protein
MTMILHGSCQIYYLFCFYLSDEHEKAPVRKERNNGSFSTKLNTSSKED